MSGMLGKNPVSSIYIIPLIKTLLTAEWQMNALRWRKLICPIHILG